ncbi:MAG: C-terminal target protein [Bacteroidetes bacterium]|nr:C-terminal target protein [Bacteroidota bacterium]
MPQLPIATIGNINPGSHTAFFCGWGFLRDSSLYYTQDSGVVWHLTIDASWCTNCHDSTILYGDQAMQNFPDDSMQWFDGHNVLYVCLTVRNKYGSSTVCDSFDIWCEAVTEVRPTDFKIYPNPASDNLLIDFSKMDNTTFTDISAIEVFDLVGQKLKSVPLSETQQSIPIKDLVDGVYIIGTLDKANTHTIRGKFEVAR